ncbi:LemA protein [Lachnospiraceae bacterium PF1-21]|uniref:LemA family protein n=1 Tax=Ohessyouella blattaphilus TaxID=2949333 RepID=A0ABT1EE57_9FIRM|nr:LemA family protein [Ohessyouella blattaphilus]MCP1108990.1 LemA family protein [Ohessyouella blattaphilus]MCR8562384.1 LemA family protein [Ohessyouella blattaphilus]
MALIIILVVVVVLIAWAIGAYNGLVQARNKVKANWSQIDVVLKRRADLIPNLVETVKGYAAHEKGTLEATIAARNKYLSAGSPEEQMQASGELTQALNRIMMLGEAYPDLKANTSFNDLQQNLKETEDKIQYARQFYNDSVYAYNNKRETFPSSIVAGMFNFKPYEMFAAEAADKEVPKVEF